MVQRIKKSQGRGHREELRLFAVQTKPGLAFHYSSTSSRQKNHQNTPDLHLLSTFTCSLFQTTKQHCLHGVWDLKLTGWDLCQQNHSWNPATSAKSHQVRIWPRVFSWLTTFAGNIAVVGGPWPAARHSSNCSLTPPPQEDGEENEIEKPMCWDKVRMITYQISWPKQDWGRIISFIAH